MNSTNNYVLCIRKKDAPGSFYRIYLAKEHENKFDLLKFRNHGKWYNRHAMNVPRTAVIGSYDVIRDVDIKKLFADML